MFADLILKVVKLIIQSISPDLREALAEFLENLEKKAAKTPNPFDDLLVELLKKVLIG